MSCHQWNITFLADTKPATFDTISTYVYNATRGSHTEIKTALWALSTLIFLIILIIVIANNIISARKEGNTDEKVNV